VSKVNVLLIVTDGAHANVNAVRQVKLPLNGTSDVNITVHELPDCVTFVTIKAVLGVYPVTIPN
jgi:hypothetical protein